jgi:nitrate reductase assembly molybdenum cofactor insertion protein NarJ
MTFALRLFARAPEGATNLRSRGRGRVSTFLPSLGMMVLALGCAGRGRQMEPTIDSSAKEVSYAAAYPTLLEYNRQQLVEDKTKATELTGQIRDRDPKSSADKELLVEIVERADSAGRSASFVAAQREARAFRTFWEEERGPISARVTAAAQKQITEGGCKDVEVGGATSYALKEGFDKQLEKRVREHNDAQQLIEQNRTVLGPAGFAELQKLADDIAYASYLVNVALIDDKNNIERMLSERRNVSSTLDRNLDDERRYQSEKARSKEEKKASDERIAALEKSRGSLDAASSDAENEVKELEQTIRQAQSDYDIAFDALRDRLKDRPEAPTAARERSVPIKTASR